MNLSNLGLLCLLLQGNAVKLEWSDDKDQFRQVFSVTCPVPRENPALALTLDRPKGLSVRIEDTAKPGQPLPIFEEEDRAWVRLSGKLLPEEERLLVASWSKPDGKELSEGLADKPIALDDYATTEYQDAWDFEEGDQEGIRGWGDRPTEYGEIQVREGRLVIPVTGDDPYFIWGGMFGQPSEEEKERIDSGLYSFLELKVRQDCEQSEWSLYVTDETGSYKHLQFPVKGTQKQRIMLDLRESFPGFWDGRVFRALRIDPTNDLPGTLVEVDSVRLLRPEATVLSGPLLSRQEVKARAKAHRLEAAYPHSAEAASLLQGNILVWDEENNPVPQVKLSLACQEEKSVVWRRLEDTDPEGIVSLECNVGETAGDFFLIAGVCDDLGRPSKPLVKRQIQVQPGPLAGYILEPDPILVPVSRGTTRLRIWARDRFGNKRETRLESVQWDVTEGGRVEPELLQGFPALATIHCSTESLVLHQISLLDPEGRQGKTEVMTLAFKKNPISISPSGHLIDGNGRLFLPLGGFYANWPSALPGKDGSVERSVDLFPCNDIPYPHGFPWEEKVENHVVNYLDLCRDYGITALRLMLRNMDLVGEVDPVQLQAVLHLLDLGWERGIRFNVVLFEDYDKPPYGNAKILEEMILPHYSQEELSALPPHRARFLAEKRLLKDSSHRYTDRDAISCQKDYVLSLLPHLTEREEIFCYELENEMVHPPMEWVREMTDFIRSIDPSTPILGNPGPHDWPEPWRWKESGVDLFSYHPYNDGQKDADHGAVVFMRSKWAAASGIPMFTGEGGINQNRWQEGVKKVPPAYAARGMRDQIWLSVCAGAIGAFMWTPGHVLELKEFGKVPLALEKLGVDLKDVQRRKPRTCLVMPKGDFANHSACRWAWHLLSLGVDFDVVIQDQTDGYVEVIEAHDPLPRPLSLQSDVACPLDGYQLATLSSKPPGPTLIYLRNVAGGIQNMGNGRACFLRETQPSEAGLVLATGRNPIDVRAFDLDAEMMAEVQQEETAGKLTLAKDTTHDYLIAFHGFDPREDSK